MLTSITNSQRNPEVTRYHQTHACANLDWHAADEDTSIGKWIVSVLSSTLEESSREGDGERTRRNREYGDEHSEHRADRELHRQDCVNTAVCGRRLEKSVVITAAIVPKIHNTRGLPE